MLVRAVGSVWAGRCQGVGHCAFLEDHDGDHCTFGVAAGEAWYCLRGTRRCTTFLLGGFRLFLLLAGDDLSDDGNDVSPRLRGHNDLWYRQCM